MLGNFFEPIIRKDVSAFAMVAASAYCGELQERKVSFAKGDR